MTNYSMHIPRAALYGTGCVIISLFLCSWVGAQQPTLAGFQKQVQRRLARDQAVRYALIEVSANQNGKFDRKKYNRVAKRASDVDDQNVAWLRKQVAKVGMPDPAVLGQECTQGFFLLILHADRDREFQRRCIGLMKKEPDQWSESYVKWLEIRASGPPPMKIKLSDPGETKNDAGEDQTTSSGDSPKSE